MSNNVELNSVLPVKLLLERKNHDHLANVLLDLLYTPGSPGPYLRTDKVEDRNSKPMKLARQTKIELREINEDCSIRSARLGLRNKTVKPREDSWQMRDHFRQSNDSNFLRVNQQLAAVGAHLLAAHAEERGPRRKLTQGVNELRAVGVARSLSRREQKIHARLILQTLPKFPKSP